MVKSMKRTTKDTHPTPTTKRQKKDQCLVDLDAMAVSRIMDFLTLKEKAACCSINKTWLHAATSDKAICLNPEEVGLNLDGAINFVAA